MKNYAAHISPKSTPQTSPIPGRPEMVENSAGGYTFTLDKWSRLQRFLVLGQDGPTYYSSERKLVLENAACIEECLKEDGPKTVEAIKAISLSGRAPKNDPALFALAIAAAKGDALTKQVALAALPEVARIGTHLFQFAEMVQSLRGWGRGLRKGIANWYLSKDVGDLAYQCIKYQQRNGWSHKDLLRLSHPKATGLLWEVLYWIVKGWPGAGEVPHPEKGLQQIWAFERLKETSDESVVVKMITDYRMVRECIPTQWLNSPKVWDALLKYALPMTAMIRNLGKMSSIGLLAPLSDAANKVVGNLTNEEYLRKARVHPLAVLSAMKVYYQGHGEKGKLTWEVNQQIVDALDEAFYLAFKAIEPTGKRWLLALDVSGSMGTGQIAGIQGLTPRVGVAVMSMVTARVEKQHHFIKFDHGVSPVDIGPSDRLDKVLYKTSHWSGGATDCALPMIYARKQGIPVDTFVVYTDNESYFGSIHPCQALQQYRDAFGISSKLIVVAMTSTGFTIADPNDPGMLDCVGMDVNAPSVMSDFARG